MGDRWIREKQKGIIFYKIKIQAKLKKLIIGDRT
jgi:hypothetical protein